MYFDFKSILDLVKAFPDESTCMAYLAEARWNGNVISPFDETSKVYKCAGNKFKCKNTGKYFNAKVGTIFEDTKIPLVKWYMALYILSSHKKGVSSHQLSKDLDVTQKTAWFMAHRLRYAFDMLGFDKSNHGIIEIDEAYIGGADKNKHANKKSGISGTKENKTPVVGLKDRKSGNVNAVVVADVTRSTVTPIIDKNVNVGSIIVTDEAGIYAKLKWDYSHTTVNHSAKQYVDGLFHTNGIENFWSHLKRGIVGIYHWVSTDHLQAYVNEYALRYNTRKFTTAGRFDLVLSNVSGRLTYKQLTK